MNNEKKSSLEKLEGALYDRGREDVVPQVHGVRTVRNEDVPTSWGERTAAVAPAKEEKGLSFGAKFLLVSTALLVCAILFTLWRVVSLRNVVSSANIDIVVDSTPYIEGGENLPVSVSINNRNTIDLKEAVLSFSYDKGVGEAEEQQKITEKRELGDIPTNQLKKENFDVVVYGEESTTRDLVAKLEYKIDGSNALFSKVVTGSVVLKSPPVSVTLDGPASLTPGQLGIYTLRVRNNSTSPSLPLKLVFNTPLTFTKDTVSPKQTSSREISWNIEPLTPGESKTYTVSGSFTGAGGESLALKAVAGSAQNGGDIQVVFSQVTKDITLRTTPLKLGIFADSDRGDVSSLRFGDRPTITITYENASNQMLRNVELEAILGGDAAVASGVLPEDGYYNSVAKSIIWNKATFPELENVRPGARGAVRVIVPIVTQGTVNPSLRLDVIGRADILEPLDVQTSSSKSWAVQGTASINGWTSYKDSPFANSGPLPPKANIPTTYTLHLVASSQNTLAGTKVSFILPVYVTWQNVFTSNANVTYNANTRTVTWNIGTLQGGKTVAADIQVSVRPSLSHVGTSPSITSGITLDAEELDSKARIKNTLNPLTTALSREVGGAQVSRVVSE
jgi:hypothetical protein